MDHDQLQRGAQVLAYEIKMLRATSKPKSDAELESFLVHARQLIEFLARPISIRFPDDLRALHYAPAWDADRCADLDVRRDDTDAETKVKFWIDKQVVHPTVRRGVPFKVEWFCERIESRILYELAEFAELASTVLLGQKLRDSLRKSRPATRSDGPYFQRHDPNRSGGVHGVTTTWFP